MSEPVTNAEVEDVLSSIRRLVSEEKRPKQAEQPRQSADRLVLTPALRVEDEPDLPETDTASFARQSGSDQGAMEAAARKLADSSDEMEPDSSDQGHTENPEGSGGEEALFEGIEDLGTDEIDPDEETSTPPSATDAKQEEHADDYSDDPYDFVGDEEGVDEDSPSFDEEEAGVDERDADPADDLTADAADETEELTDLSQDAAREADATSDDHDMFDFGVLKNRRREMASEQMNTDMEPSRAEPEAAPVQSADAPDADRQAGLAAANKAATLSAKIAALETAIGNIADTWEPDTPDTDDYSGTSQPAMAWEDDVSRDATGVPLRAETKQSNLQETQSDVPTIGAAKVIAAAASAAKDEQSPVEKPSDAADQEKRARAAAADDQEAKDRAIAAARAAAAARLAANNRAAEEHEQQALAAQEEEASQQEQAAVQEPETETAAVPSTAVETEATAETETGGGLEYTDDSQLIDEDALRDLVSEIVRAELQGALGERITRNVRKLVRREIHRALTAQELE
ncbi:hypothetical protein [Sulfitobacter sp. JB4-11]|uniref:hypothetical protein n=1 Tax=Sulfitobacter rhodophyticola TaxID=3238304 RepID=UPI003512523F